AGGAGQIPLQAIDQLQGRVHWQRTTDGWQLDAPSLGLAMQGAAHRFDHLTLAAGDDYALLADHIDVQPLVALALLSDRVPGPLRHWLLQAQPHAVLSAVDLQGRRGVWMRGGARIDGLGFSPIGDAPGLDGLAADVRGDADGFSAQLDASQ